MLMCLCDGMRVSVSFLRSDTLYWMQNGKFFMGRINNNSWFCLKVSIIEKNVYCYSIFNFNVNVFMLWKLRMLWRGNLFFFKILWNRVKRCYSSLYLMSQSWLRLTYRNELLSLSSITINLKIYTTVDYIVSLILLSLGHVFRFHIVSRMCQLEGEGLPC